MSTEFDPSFLTSHFDAPVDPSALAGVLFADDFEFDAAAAPPLLPESAPVYDAAQLDAARVAGHTDGLVAARIDATVRARAAAEHAATALGTALEQARADSVQVARQAAQALADAMLRMVAAALPEFCARHGPAEAYALAEALLPLLAQEPSIVIRANPHTLAGLAQIVARQHSAQPERVRLIGTDALANGDVSIEWQDGMAVRDAATLSRTFSDALAPLGLDPSTALAPQEPKREFADAG